MEVKPQSVGNRSIRRTTRWLLASTSGSPVLDAAFFWREKLETPPGNVDNFPQPITKTNAVSTLGLGGGALLSEGQVDTAMIRLGSRSMALLRGASVQFRGPASRPKFNSSFGVPRGNAAKSKVGDAIALRIDAAPASLGRSAVGDGGFPEVCASSGASVEKREAPC